MTGLKLELRYSDKPITGLNHVEEDANLSSYILSIKYNQIYLINPMSSISIQKVIVCL